MRPSRGVYSAGFEPTTTRLASPRALSLEGAEVRHFSHRTAPVYASPLPLCQRQSEDTMVYRDAIPSVPYSPFSRAVVGVGYSRSSGLGSAPRTDFSIHALRPLSALAGAPDQPSPCGGGQIQPAYWFQGATPTPWLSHPIMSTLGFHRRGGWALAGSCLAV